jgi:hypothetical protein
MTCIAATVKVHLCGPFSLVAAMETGLVFYSKQNLMKRSWLILLIFSCSWKLEAQNIVCGDDLFHQQVRSEVKDADQKIIEMNLRIKEYVDLNLQNRRSQRARPSSMTTPSTYLIPVVFHIVHNGEIYGSGTNISYAQIQSQLAALNAAFAKNYPAYNGQTHPSYAQNTDIQFCLARIAKPSTVNFYNGPQGLEYGVMRYNDPSASAHQLSNTGALQIKNLTHPTTSHFPFENYLNIWIVSSISAGIPGTIEGYAPTPLASPFPLDGVIMRSSVTGDNSTSNTFSLSAVHPEGKVLVHEVGHYLNLRHIFEGACSGANAIGSSTDACDMYGDYVCDTEPSSTQNFQCWMPVPNTCVANYTVNTTTMDMIENYMSYAEDNCQNTFTSGQTDRMWATLATLRNDLWQYNNLGTTGVMGTGGCVPSALYTDIRTGAINNCINSPIQLSNFQAGNAATNFTWSTTGGLFSAANSSSTTVTFSTAGIYKIILKVSKVP